LPGAVFNHPEAAWFMPERPALLTAVQKLGRPPADHAKGMASWLGWGACRWQHRLADALKESRPTLMYSHRWPDSQWHHMHCCGSLADLDHFSK
jgi:hypothetical protein